MLWCADQSGPGTANTRLMSPRDGTVPRSSSKVSSGEATSVNGSHDTRFVLASIRRPAECQGRGLGSHEASEHEEHVLLLRGRSPSVMAPDVGGG